MRSQGGKEVAEEALERKTVGRKASNLGSDFWTIKCYTEPCMNVKERILENDLW